MLKRLFLSVAALLLLLPFVCQPVSYAAGYSPKVMPNDPQWLYYRDVAAQFSPIFYQNVREKGDNLTSVKKAGLDGIYDYQLYADYPTAADYDGDWNARNNWNNLTAYKDALLPLIYYDVKETETHYFIGYYLYYPKDDDHDEGGRHENDMEGMLVVVRKGSENGGLGAPQMVVLGGHGKFYQSQVHPYGSGLQNSNDDFDTQGIRMAGSHPEVFVTFNGGSWDFLSGTSSSGHNLMKWNGDNTPVDQSFGGMRLSYNGTFNYYDNTTIRNAKNNLEYTDVNYWLQPATELWSKRNEIGPDNLFSEFGKFSGDEGSDNAANAPWNWSYRDGQAGLEKGSIFYDPALVVSYMVSGWGNFSYKYVLRDDNNQDLPGVYLYQHPNGEGRMQRLTSSDLDLRNGLVGNDSITSVRVVGSMYQATIYSDIDAGGSPFGPIKNTDAGGSYVNLHLNQSGMDNLTSSVLVTQAP